MKLNINTNVMISRLRMRRVLLFIGIAIVLGVANAAAPKGPCSALVAPGTTKPKYDLTPLAGKTFQASTSDGAVQFQWGICSTVSCQSNPNAGVCQTQVQSGITVVGALWNPDKIVTVATPDANTKGIGLLYTEPTFDRQIDIFVYCDKKAKEAHTFTALFPQNTAQNTVLSFYHEAGCPKKSGLSGGSICLIILVVVLVLYFIVGFLWKRFKQGKEGTDAIPNFLYKDLPGLVKDGFMFLVAKCRGESSNYETVA